MQMGCQTENLKVDRVTALAKISLQSTSTVDTMLPGLRPFPGQNARYLNSQAVQASTVPFFHARCCHPSSVGLFSLVWSSNY